MTSKQRAYLKSLAMAMDPIFRIGKSSMTPKLTKKKGKRCLVIDKRNHITGNIYNENIEGINVHKYGAHIFHTSNKYGIISISLQSLEEQALSLVGTDVYKKLIKGYTEKQWGRACIELPAFIIKRLPLRFTYDNNYFNDRYQGIPIGGYTKIVEKMLEGIDVKTNIDYFEYIKVNCDIAEKTVFTGMIDEYFGYKLGTLEYRSVRFETEILNEENYQGNAVVNYTQKEIPYTRIIEHKHFEYGKQEKTVISREYSSEWQQGMEPYYPVNNEQNNHLFEQYSALVQNESNVIFGGRLGHYKYYDMDKVIEVALETCEKEL